MPFIFGILIGYGIVVFIGGIISFVVTTILMIIALCLMANSRGNSKGNYRNGYTYRRWKGENGKIYTYYTHPTWRKPEIRSYTPYPPGLNWYQKIAFDFKLLGKNIWHIITWPGRVINKIWHGLVTIWGYLVKFYEWIKTGWLWLYDNLDKYAPNVRNH